MGQEEKKPEETKMEEKKAEKEKKEGKEEGKQPDKPEEEKKEEKKPDESKEGGDGKESKEETPAMPPEIVLKVYMHCEGCARKVRRSLKGFQGVEDVITDCKTHKVVVKGEKADPLKVLERIQRKSHRQVELLSPIPKAPEEEKKPEEKEKPKPEEKKEEPQIVTVVLKVHMHCEACAQEIKRRIQRMKGVESAEPDLKNSQVSVKGVFEPPKLVEYVYKRTGKQAVIVKQDTGKEKEGKEEKKGEEAGAKEKKGEEEAKKEGESEGKAGGEGGGGPEEGKVVELKKNEYYYYPPRYAMGMYAYPPQIFSDENPNAYQPQIFSNAYPPQIFSDENPNACSVM